METALTILTLFLVTVAALALVLGAVRMLDKVIFPNLSFEDALGENNIAVAVFLAALVLGIFYLASNTLAADVNRYDRDFRKWGRYQFGYAVDWRYFKAQGMTESGLDPSVCSHVNACGVMQFMPGTALAMGLTDRFDARASIRLGIKYDRRMWDQFTAPRPKLDRLAFAFMSYNAGLGNVLKFQRAAVAAGVNPNLFETLKPFAWREPREYVERIRRWRQRFRGGLGWAG